MKQTVTKIMKQKCERCAFFCCLEDIQTEEGRQASEVRSVPEVLTLELASEAPGGCVKFRFISRVASSEYLKLGPKDLHF